MGDVSAQAAVKAGHTLTALLTTPPSHTCTCTPLLTAVSTPPLTSSHTCTHTVSHTHPVYTNHHIPMGIHTSEGHVPSHVCTHAPTHTLAHCGRTASRTHPHAHPSSHVRARAHTRAAGSPVIATVAPALSHLTTHGAVFLSWKPTFGFSFTPIFSLSFSVSLFILTGKDFFSISLSFVVFTAPAAVARTPHLPGPPPASAVCPLWGNRSRTALLVSLPPPSHLRRGRYRGRMCEDEK